MLIGLVCELSVEAFEETKFGRTLLYNLFMDDFWTGKDEWFDKYYSDKITPVFAKWWSDLYGLPESYEDGTGEYFVRMGFAWLGWNACYSVLVENAITNIKR